MSKSKKISDAVEANMNDIINSDDHYDLFAKKKNSKRSSNKSQDNIWSSKPNSPLEIIGRLIEDSQRLDDIGMHKTAVSLLKVIESTFKESKEINNQIIVKSLLNQLEGEPTQEKALLLEKYNWKDSSDVMFALDEDDKMKLLADSLDIENLPENNSDVEDFEDEP